jgi:hypothetical protein
MYGKNRDLRYFYLDCLIYIGIMLKCIFHCWDKLELKQLTKKLVSFFFSVGVGLGVPKRGVIFSSNWLFIGYVSLL